MTRKELKNSPKYTLHHHATTRGYVSRKADIDELPAKPYNGKFGKGYTVKTPRWDSTQYCYIEYWIEK